MSQICVFSYSDFPTHKNQRSEYICTNKSEYMTNSLHKKGRNFLRNNKEKLCLDLVDVFTFQIENPQTTSHILKLFNICIS